MTRLTHKALDDTISFGKKDDAWAVIIEGKVGAGSAASRLLWAGNGCAVSSTDRRDLRAPERDGF